MISPETAHARIEELAGLEEDWDSYGAYPMAPEAIAAAHALVDKRPHLLQTIYPVPNGGFILVWSFFPYEVEVEVMPDGTYGATIAQTLIDERDNIPEEMILEVIDNAATSSKDRRDRVHVPWRV